MNSPGAGISPPSIPVPGAGSFAHGVGVGGRGANTRWGTDGAASALQSYSAGSCAARDDAAKGENVLQHGSWLRRVESRPRPVLLTPTEQK